MNETNQAAVDSAFGDILDTNLDDIADLPEYLDYAPNGFYRVKIVEAERKVVEVDRAGTKVQAPVVQITYEMQEIKELSKPEEADLVKVPDGSGSKGSYFNESIFFDKDPKKAQEIFKAKFKDIAAKFNTGNIVATLEVMQGLDIVCVVQSKEDKAKGKFWISAKNIVPA